MANLLTGLLCLEVIAYRWDIAYSRYGEFLLFVDYFIVAKCSLICFLIFTAIP